MDPHFAPANAAGVDIVHIENPGADESLNESIVNIEEEPPPGDDDDSTSYEDDFSEKTRAVLPEELSRSVVALTCESLTRRGVCDVYLVGIAHMSQESCRKVQAVISFLKPQVVFLELCSSRVDLLTPQNIEVANKLEVIPGSEFRVAYEEAMKYGGRVFLGDLPFPITIRRIWTKMPLQHKIKLLSHMLFQAVFSPSPEDLNRMLKEVEDGEMLSLVAQEMSKEFPTLMETLVHERDKYMSSRLLSIAREYSVVVAVVGKGHLEGIKKNWKQPVGIRELLTMPPQKPAISTLNILTSLGVAVAGAAISYGIYLADKK